MKKILLYPFWLRFWHWFNALLFMILIASGLSLHYTDPGSGYFSFRVAMFAHNVSGIILSLNYLFFFIRSIISGNILHYIPKIKGFFSRLLIQARYYLLGIFIGEPHPYHSSLKNKFNPMQQITYLSIMFGLMPLIIISGLLLMFPEIAPDQLLGMGGVWPMAFAHTIIGFFLSLFMVGHIYLGTTGNTIFDLFKSMINGWHLEHEPEDEEHHVEPKPITITRKKIGKLLPVMLYNPITMTGAVMSGLSFILIFFLILISFFSPDTNPYIGIVTFVVLPSILILGLLLIAWGAIKENRRLLQMSEQFKKLPVIDLNNPKHQLAVMLFTIGTVLIVIMSVYGTFKAYEYTDSDEFCGQVCHKVMKPEYTAFLDSPHSRVGCVKCHIGTGSDWLVKAKLSGAYQVYSVLFNKYPRPIQSPIVNLRPTQQTCEQCHWPKHFYNEKKVSYDYFTSDENNSEYKLTMIVKVGGGNHEFGNNQGIHWVMNIDNEISYLALDQQRNVIPWVKSVSRSDGKERVYKDTTVKFDSDLLKSDKIKKFDCIDCHNRQSHIFSDPHKTLNTYLSTNVIDRTIPYIKNIGVQALEYNTHSRNTAFDDIKKYVYSYYKENYEDVFVAKKPAIDKAILELSKVYLRNYFPEMKANWKNYPNNIGHVRSPGCFRCHDGNHWSNDGKVISNDCNVCHLMVYQKLPNQLAEESSTGLNFIHPGGLDKITDTKDCIRCHGAYPKMK